MQHQCFIRTTGQESVEHKRRKEAVVIKVQTHQNKSVPKSHRSKWGWLWFCRHYPKAAAEIIDRLQHWRPRQRSRGDRAKHGPTVNTFRSLRRAINAGWQHPSTIH